MKKYPKQAKAARKPAKGMKTAKPAKKTGLVELGKMKPRKTATKMYRKKK